MRELTVSASSASDWKAVIGRTIFVEVPSVFYGKFLADENCFI
jgi:hypothetical protein